MSLIDRRAIVTIVAGGLVAGGLVAGVGCGRRNETRPGVDSSFVALQARGAEGMGVDQYNSDHVFDDLPDGGRIVLERRVADSAGVAQVRRHMRQIADAFAHGDFTVPGFVHAQHVPGTAVMSARRERITYRAADRPQGGEVRITTTDAAALAAVHQFLAFQRREHHAAGHEGHRM